MKKSYNDKLKEVGDLPKIVDLSDKPEFIKRYNAKTMYIASPVQYDNIMKKVPKGQVITSDRIKVYLAKNANTDVTCSLTAGIFMNICANAAIEREDYEYPYWRTLKTNGELNEKYPGGIEEQKKHLKSEGFIIVQKGKKHFVTNYENKLWEIK